MKSTLNLKRKEKTMNHLIHRFNVGLALPGVLFLTALALTPRAEAADTC